MSKKKVKVERGLSLNPAPNIEQRILFLRGQRVLLDTDLAALYGVPTFRLNEAVKRNADRFPDDFLFQLTNQEATALTSQFAISKVGRGGRRTLPWVFTEHGAIQASNVLNSPRAVDMGIYVVRAFVRLRQVLASNRELAHRLDALESRIESKLSTHDKAIAQMIQAIRQLMTPPVSKRKPIGFIHDED